jgi:hypothetical protein
MKMKRSRILNYLVIAQILLGGLPTLSEAKKNAGELITTWKLKIR